MDKGTDFGTKLSILQDILDKKRAALTAILNICENQEQLYLSSPSDMRRDFLVEMGKEKQAQIDEVISCDEVFQRTFDGIREEFAQKGEQYGEKVRAMQEAIKDVVDLDIKIRTQEERSKLAARDYHSNLAKVSQSKGKNASANPANKNYMLEQYNNQKKPDKR